MPLNVIRSLGVASSLADTAMMSAGSNGQVSAVSLSAAASTVGSTALAADSMAGTSSGVVTLDNVFCVPPTTAAVFRAASFQSVFFYFVHYIHCPEDKADWLLEQGEEAPYKFTFSF